MAENDFEKTEAPTQRRRDEARQEGNVARSTDLSAVCVLLAGVVLLNVFGLKLLSALKTTVQATLSTPVSVNPTRPEDLAALPSLLTRLVLQAMAPLVLGITAVALLINVGQVGLIVTTKPLVPNLSKVSPLRGMQNMFNARSGFRLLMSLGKILAIGSVAVLVIRADMGRIMMLCELEPMPMFGLACELVYSLALKLAMVLLVLALLDYMLQRWQHTRDLRMSKLEVKEELKRMEGDPLVKQRRQRVARQIALQRIGQAVPKADVVVTNPTHFAVALQYDAKAMAAPKVVAKGADYLALRIRQLAITHGVPLVERKELARAMYKTVEVGQQVPPQFYNAVAEILAYVYRLGRRKTG